MPVFPHPSSIGPFAANAQVSDARRKLNLDIVKKVFESGGRKDPFMVPLAIAQRESAFNHLVEHMQPGDRRGARRSYERNKDRLFRGNPYLENMDHWDRGRGLFAMMPGYHLHRVDPLASPVYLQNPFFSALAAARLVNSCTRSGAKTWAHVNQCWATGSPKETSKFPARRKRLMARLKKLGYDPRLADRRVRQDNWGRKYHPDYSAHLQAIASKYFGIPDWRMVGPNPDTYPNGIWPTTRQTRPTPPVATPKPRGPISRHPAPTPRPRSPISRPRPTPPAAPTQPTGPTFTPKRPIGPTFTPQQPAAPTVIPTHPIGPTFTPGLPTGPIVIVDDGPIWPWLLGGGVVIGGGIAMAVAMAGGKRQ